MQNDLKQQLLFKWYLLYGRHIYIEHVDRLDHQIAVTVIRVSPHFIPRRDHDQHGVFIITHITSSHLISTDRISSELRALWLIAAMANRVASLHTTQLATNHSTLGSDKTRSLEIRRWGEISDVNTPWSLADPDWVRSYLIQGVHLGSRLHSSSVI